MSISGTILDDYEAIVSRSRNGLYGTRQREPWGTGLVETAEHIAAASVATLQKWAQDDPNAWTDDALRLMGGGLKNVGTTMNDWMQRSEDGNIGLRSAAGTALRFMDWTQDKGADVGGAAIQMLGGNEKLGRFAGGMVADVALGGIAGYSAKAAKAAVYTKGMKTAFKISRSGGLGKKQADILIAADMKRKAQSFLGKKGSKTGEVWQGNKQQLEAVEGSQFKLTDHEPAMQFTDQAGMDDLLANPKLRDYEERWLPQRLDSQMEQYLKTKRNKPKSFWYSDAMTPSSVIDDSPFWYQRGPSGLIEKHHLGVQKVEGFGVYEKMRDLVRAGDADLEDVVNIQLMQTQIMPGGSRRSAMYEMYIPPHKDAHLKMIAKKLQIPVQDKPLETIRARVASMDKVELTEFYHWHIKNIAIPAKKIAIEYEEVFEKVIRLGESSLTAKQRKLWSEMEKSQKFMGGASAKDIRNIQQDMTQRGYGMQHL